MATSIVQTLPKRSGDQVEHLQWLLDLDAAACVGRWPEAAPDRLEREAVEMARHFPRWLLTLAQGQQLLVCSACGGMVVFDRGIRCVQCARGLPRAKVPGNTRLAWFGLMPPMGIDSLRRLREGLSRHVPRRHVVGHSPQVGTYLLAPLLAVYPETFPTDAPRVSYFPEFFSIPGMPGRGVAHAHHMLGEDVMCLFASGQWQREMTCREVLQQRAYAHVVKLLNFADGNSHAFASVTR